MRILVILGTFISLSTARPDIGLELQKYNYEKPANQLNYNTQSSSSSHSQSHSQSQGVDQGNRFGAPVEASSTGFTSSGSSFQEGGQEPVVTSYEHAPSGPAQSNTQTAFGTDSGSSDGSNQFGIDNNGISTASGQGYQIITTQNKGVSGQGGSGSVGGSNAGSGGQGQFGGSSGQQFGGSSGQFGGSSGQQFGGSSGQFGGSSGQQFGGSSGQSTGNRGSSGDTVIQGQSSVLNIGTGSSSSAGGTRKVIRPIIKAGEPIIKKSFYVHAAPEDDDEEEGNVDVEERVQTVRPEKHYKIIFIKAPTQKAPKYGGFGGAGGAYPQNEEKTIVYVLVNKAEGGDGGIEDGGEIPTPPPAVTSKPEVYFIKYKTKAEADNFVSNIQNAVNQGQSHNEVLAGQNFETGSGISTGSSSGQNTGINIGESAFGQLGAENQAGLDIRGGSDGNENAPEISEKYLPAA